NLITRRLREVLGVIKGILAREGRSPRGAYRGMHLTVKILIVSLTPHVLWPTVHLGISRSQQPYIPYAHL
ncbi:hypothetical protein EV363DRAFT_1189505, partial [Boletus edulis]